MRPEYDTACLWTKQAKYTKQTKAYKNIQVRQVINGTQSFDFPSTLAFYCVCMNSRNLQNLSTTRALIGPKLLVIESAKPRKTQSFKTIIMWVADHTWMTSI